MSHFGVTFGPSDGTDDDQTATRIPIRVRSPGLSAFACRLVGVHVANGCVCFLLFAFFYCISGLGDGRASFVVVGIALPTSHLRDASLNCWFELLRLKMQDALDCHGLLDN